MREIKMRVHDKATGEILAHEYFNTCLNWGYFYLDEKEVKEKGGEAICHASVQYYRHPSPLGNVFRVLYTGIVVKNEKELYEGDIFNLGDKNILYVVEWTDTGLKGRQIGNQSLVGLEYWKDNIEIVGNRFTNPNLIAG